MNIDASVDRWKPLFHLFPQRGWMNDPNGLAYFKSYYHVYFQYSEDPRGGLKLWGHFRSKDLINWERCDEFLFPDRDFDKDGVYSGSSFEKDGKLYIFYTGNVKHKGDYDYINSGRGHNTVLVISEDGINASEKEVLLYNKDYPDNLSCHVRDPKVFEYESAYYMVLGARTLDSKGELLVFESQDLHDWKHINTITTDYEFGYMWECPDLINIKGQWILILSPQGLERAEFFAQNTYSCGYFMLDGDFRKDAKLRDYKELDQGFDFYAPQTFDAGGRKYLLAWMGMPDAEYTNPTVDYGWQHCMTVFRELDLVDERLRMYPLRELKALYEKETSFKIDNTGGFDDEGMDVSGMDIFIENSSTSFELLLANTLRLSYEHGILSMEHIANAYGRTVRKLALEELSNLRILVDSSSVELFVNDCNYSMSSRYYPSENKGLYIAGTASVKICDITARKY